MTKTKKIVITALAVCLLFAYMLINDPSRHITLKLGIFVGSNFDVYNGDSYAIIDEAIAQFEEAHPQISIEYESGIVKSDYSSWLSTKILKGEQLDVFMVLNEDFNTLASIHALQNLDGYISNGDDFYEGILASGQYDGHLYAMPYEASSTMMCINRDLLERENIAIPDADWTMDDFLEICQQVSKDHNQDGKTDQFGCCNYGWQDALYGYGATLFDESGKHCYLNDAKDALSFVQKLQALNNGYQPTSDDFDQGNVAFCPLTIAQYRTYQPYPYRVSKYSTFSWYCLPMPGYQDNQKTATCQTSMMAINAKSQHKDEAYEFIELLTGTEIQRQLLEKSQGVSVLKSVMNSEVTRNILQNEDELNLDLLDHIMKNMIVQPKFKNYDQVMEKADYLISRSINNNQIELDIYAIEQQLTDELIQ